MQERASYGEMKMTLCNQRLGNLKTEFRHQYESYKDKINRINIRRNKWRYKRACSSKLSQKNPKKQKKKQKKQNKKKTEDNK